MTDKATEKAIQRARNGENILDVFFSADGETAEKARGEYEARLGPVLTPSHRNAVNSALVGFDEGFLAGRASRDAEVAALDAQIAKGGTIVQRAADMACRTPFSLQQATEALTFTTDAWRQLKEAEADRDAARKALGESRARFGDMEQRALAAEAVIEKVRALHPVRRTHTGSSTHGGPEQYALTCGTCGVLAPCAHLRAIGTETGDTP